MRLDALEIDVAAHSQAPAPPQPFDLGRAEAIRMLLAGGSIIDWHKAAFSTMDDVDRLLRLNLFEPGDPADERRLRYLLNEAAAYVEEIRGTRILPEIRSPEDVRQLFLWASNTQGFRRRQMLSCMTLKLMHVINHMESADLKLKADVSEYDLLALAHARVLAASARMRMEGPNVVAFYGSRKTRAAVIQKLLAKRDNVAATIFDKLRYRVVVATPADVRPALCWLLDHLVPFHDVIPGQSHNNLLDPHEIVDALDPDARGALQPHQDDVPRAESFKNEFSGSTYRMINFIADLPVQLPSMLLPRGMPEEQHGRVVHVMVEFQVVDELTAKTNELGENSHARYKARQWQRVTDRLGRGAYVK
jgi:uncharacterized protein (TIGR04552 family)